MEPKQPLSIGLACGGTGGHVFPGLATGAVLKQRGHKVTLWLAGKDIEAEAVANWEGPRITVRSEGFQYGLSPRSLMTFWKIQRACRCCWRIMRDDIPDVLLAMGSYASVGPISAAHRLHVPVVLHEANVLPGRAIRYFSRRAAAVAGSFEESRHYLRRAPLTVTGFPLRRELVDAAREYHLRAGVHEKFTILVMGGSRGARALNVLTSDAVVALHHIQPEIQVIHLTGAADEKTIKARYREADVPAQVLAFSKDMVPLYLAADIAICRAGAATCAELSAFGIPSLLVPYPHASNDHQTANAKAMERIGAADLVPEQDLDATWLTEYLDGCMNTPSRLARISAASRSRAQTDAAENLADLVEKTALDNLVHHG